MILQKSDEIFDALGNPVRRDILRLLLAGPQSVGQISGELPISRPAVSRHLKLLENVNLVTHVTLGNRNIFQLESDGFEEAEKWLRIFWDDALARFKLVAENTTPEEM